MRGVVWSAGTNGGWWSAMDGGVQLMKYLQHQRRQLIESWEELQRQQHTCCSQSSPMRTTPLPPACHTAPNTTVVCTRTEALHRCIQLLSLQQIRRNKHPFSDLPIKCGTAQCFMCHCTPHYDTEVLVSRCNSNCCWHPLCTLYRNTWIGFRKQYSVGKEVLVTEYDACCARQHLCIH